MWDQTDNETFHPKCEEEALRKGSTRNELHNLCNSDYMRGLLSVLRFNQVNQYEQNTFQRTEDLFGN